MSNEKVTGAFPVKKIAGEPPTAPNSGHARGVAAADTILSSSSAAGTMGPIELAVYRKDWAASLRHRRYAEKVAEQREHELIMKRLEAEALKAVEKTMRDTGKKSARKSSLSALRKSGTPDNDREEEGQEISIGDRPLEPGTAGQVAARLLLARYIDAVPGLLESLHNAAPVVIIDVPEREMLVRLMGRWKDVLWPEGARLLPAAKCAASRRDDYDAIFLFCTEPAKAKERITDEMNAVDAIAMALPIIALSPIAETYLPEPLLRSSPVRLQLPKLDAAVITRTIRIVTGKRCRAKVKDDLIAKISFGDFLVAVRFGRSPEECIAVLRRLADEKADKRKSRDLTLDELHGLPDAVAWAKSTIADLAAWKRGEIVWDQIDGGAVLNGPPGTGKTTFARVFASEAGIPMVAGTLAKWQSSDEAHLGHLLRAMRRDFDAARAQAPSVMFIDEVDSFPARDSVKHSHRDYVIEVVNAFIEQLDGIGGREGVIVLAASNDVRRCDPAILRAGRLNRIIQISPPDLGELQKMLRVRLGRDLAGIDLEEICILALGSTGADVEKYVKDARRTARHAKRELTFDDLRRAIVDEEDRPEEIRRRACFHEAAHIMIDVIHHGPKDVYASTTLAGHRGGASIRIKGERRAGVYADYSKQLQGILAGRIAEQIVFGHPCHGSGGADDSDLGQATKIAAAMVASLGLAGPEPLVYLGSGRETAELLAYPHVREAVHVELSKAEKYSRELIISNRDALDEIAAVLIACARIDGIAVDAIVTKWKLPLVKDRPESTGTKTSEEDGGSLEIS